VSEQVVAKVFDISGELIPVVRETANNYFRFGDNFISGIYIEERRQGDERKQMKIIKQ
jgi:hypothetical protein